MSGVHVCVLRPLAIASIFVQYFVCVRVCLRFHLLQAGFGQPIMFGFNEEKYVRDQSFSLHF